MYVFSLFIIQQYIRLYKGYIKATKRVTHSVVLTESINLTKWVTRIQTE